MIDRKVFAREMALLQDRFDRDLAEPVLERYHETLSQHLSTPEFELAARLAFDNERYWPAPMRLVELAKASTQTTARAEWEKLLAAVRSNAKPELSPAGAHALEQIGGWWRVANSHEIDQLPWVRREFLQAYEDLEQDNLRTATRDQLEATSRKLLG